MVKALHCIKMGWIKAEDLLFSVNAFCIWGPDDQSTSCSHRQSLAAKVLPGGEFAVLLVIRKLGCPVVSSFNSRGSPGAKHQHW